MTELEITVAKAQAGDGRAQKLLAAIHVLGAAHAGESDGSEFAQELVEQYTSLIKYTKKSKTWPRVGQSMAQRADGISLRVGKTDGQAQLGIQSWSVFFPTLPGQVPPQAIVQANSVAEACAEVDRLVPVPDWVFHMRYENPAPLLSHFLSDPKGEDAAGT